MSGQGVVPTLRHWANQGEDYSVEIGVADKKKKITKSVIKKL